MGGSFSRLFPLWEKFTEGGENARIKYAASSMQGCPKQMEDAHAAVPDLDDVTSFFGVYDGHGGAEVALFCAKQFHSVLRNHQEFHYNLHDAMRSVFFRMDELLEQSGEWMESLPRGNSSWIQCLGTGVCANYWSSTQANPYVAPQQTGSTACVAAIRGHKIIVGNVGDSRCIVSRNGQAFELTIAHKPHHRIERRRIQRAGGQLVRDLVLDRSGSEPQFSVVTRINGILPISRVIGDFAFKSNQNFPPQEQMATCVPEFRTLDITNDIEFLVMGSAGIWDCMTSQAVVDVVRHYFSLGVTDDRYICEKLCDRVINDHYRLDILFHDSMYSAENVTVILVQFKDASRAPPPRPSTTPRAPSEKEGKEEIHEEDAPEE